MRCELEVHSHRVTQHSLEVLKQKCYQVKFGSQIRQNFRLQCKHTTVPGLSQALLRKSTQSKKKTTKYLITDHDNKQVEQQKNLCKKPF